VPLSEQFSKIHQMPDSELETLLDLHGWTAEIGGGYWVSFKAFRVPADAGRPHGVNYALTMHTPGDSRLVGYDNAHAPGVYSGPSKRSRQRLLYWDHRHWRDSVYVYEFISAAQLVCDFWTDVEKMLAEERQR
jgi:hypothetical protein